MDLSMLRKEKDKYSLVVCWKAMCLWKAQNRGLLLHLQHMKHTDGPAHSWKNILSRETH